jgi:hypothetical protein
MTTPNVTNQESALNASTPANGSADWVTWNKHLPDGVYLTKFEEWDDDQDAETYHVRAGKFYKPTGEQWVCYGGVWKRIGNLPNNRINDK